MRKKAAERKQKPNKRDETIPRSSNGTLPSPLSLRSATAPALQPKLKVNPTNDRFEQEAEAVAASVKDGGVKGSQNPRSSDLLDHSTAQAKKRQSDQLQTQEEGETLQTQRAENDAQRTGDEGLQSQVDENDVQRAEQDEVQAQSTENAIQRVEQKETQVQSADADVQRMEKEAVQTQSDESIHPQSDVDSIQAMADKATQKSAPLQAQANDEPTLQRQKNPESTAADQNPRGIQLSANKRPPQVSPETEATIRNPQRGKPLDPTIKPQVEDAVGADLSRVEVHTDPQAHAAAAQINAQAFTHRNHIFLSEKARETDVELMTHETTHVVQQGAADRIKRRAHSAGLVSRQATPDGSKELIHKAPSGNSGFLELKGRSTFPAEMIDPLLDRRQRAVVNVRYGKVAQGTVEVRKWKNGYQLTKKGSKKTHALPLNSSHPLVGQLGLSLLLITNSKGEISGKLGFATLKDLNLRKLTKAPEKLGLPGFRFAGQGKVVNSLQAGRLQIGIEGAVIRLGGAFSGEVTIVADETQITRFEGTADVSARGLATGKLKLNYVPEKGVTGSAKVGLKLPKQFSGDMEVLWDGTAVTGTGTVGYSGEKLSGSVTLKLMDEQQAKQLAKEKKAPKESGENGGAGRKKDKKAAPARRVKYVVFGEGDLTFSFTDWLNGTAHVIVDQFGHVTIIGKITPQKEFELFPQKDYNKHLFKIEARASYGIPIVGNVFIFANFGMDAFAKLGPAKFHKIEVAGTYSTDPKKNKDFSIKGSLNISAAAGMRLRGEAGVGVQILAHDIKAGAGINAIAGIRGYAEATPTIGYREKGAETGDKKGEFYIRGDLEMAAQPFLGLGGDLFVEIDAPWWSPVPDKKWTWPLGSKEYPLGGSLGVMASVDYVFGSNQWPSIEIKPAEFRSDKFLTDLYSDKAKGKSAKKQQSGKWKEKNTKGGEPPSKEDKTGGANTGKLPKQAKAKPKVEPGGAKKATQQAPNNARTAEGKTVAEYKREAARKGGKPATKEPGKGAAKGTQDPKAKGKAKEKQDKGGIAGAKAVVKGALKARLPKGASQVEDVNKVLKDVAGKAKPSLTNLTATEVNRGKPKTEGAIGFKVTGRDAKRKSVPIATVAYSKSGTALSHEERWKIGVKGVKKSIKKLEKRKVSPKIIKAQFPKWQSQYGFKSMKLQTEKTPWKLVGEMSPGKDVTNIDPKGKKFGTRKNPYRIKWHKRKLENYPKIKIRPKPESDFITVGPTERKLITISIPENQKKGRLLSYEIQLKNRKYALSELVELRRSNPKMLKDALNRLQESEKELARLRALPPNEHRGKIGPQDKISRYLRYEIKKLKKKEVKIKEIPKIRNEINFIQREIDNIRKSGESKKYIGISKSNPLRQSKKIVGPRIKSPEYRYMEKEFKKFMSAAGYDLGENQMAPEHVVDLSLSGPDKFSNLWPLDSGENISPNQEIDTESGMEVGEFKEAGKTGKHIIDKTFIEERAYFLIEGYKK